MAAAAALLLLSISRAPCRRWPPLCYHRSMMQQSDHMNAT
uniref:Uncharacterized protein n=1 Tax=Arundo donax TaxID=35708 RepID=A0A0A9E423_ARUDO